MAHCKTNTVGMFFASEDFNFLTEMSLFFHFVFKTVPGECFLKVPVPIYYATVGLGALTDFPGIQKTPLEQLWGPRSRQKKPPVFDD